MQVEKLIDAAVDLRVATLRAREQSIISYTRETKDVTEEQFQIYSEKDFREMIKTRPYSIKKYKSGLYKYEYLTKVCGLNFIYITTDLLNADDERLVENEA